jgi:hypothetical protein
MRQWRLRRSMLRQRVRLTDLVAGSRVTGSEVTESDVAVSVMGSGVRGTTPPMGFSQECDFMGVIFRRSVRV